ncbi:MAG TPA: right-handed parallel beta-helix repeat-containing protein [Pyrinomonadaceae bacterium]|jgi:hypothetical protein
MSKFRFAFNALAVLVFTLVGFSAAQAQATRTWVSGVGDDVNPCSRTAPCKTYAGAISKTAKDGEISTLDPGGFGTITITKSITISGGGNGQGYGSILSALAPQGVLVNITDAADVRKTVRLDGLNINGASSGTDGIRMIAGNAIHIENCVIDGVTGQGIEINTTTASATEVYIKNVSVRNAVTDGILLTHASQVVVASLTDVHVGNCGNGLTLGNRSRATVRGGTFHSNSTAGVNVTATVGGGEATLQNCSISNNPTGVIGGAAPNIVRISQTAIYGNSTSLTGNVKSWGNNYIDGNTVNNAPVLPNLTQL